MRRWRYPRTRRGKFLHVPPAQVVVAAPAYVDGRRRFRRRRTAFRVRRATYFRVPLVGAAPPAPPVYPPQRIQRRRRRTFLDQRGKFFHVPPPQQVQVVVVPPRYVRQTRRRFMPRRRAGFFWTPPVVVVVAAPSVPPQRVAYRRRLAVRFRRFTRFFRGPVPPAVLPRDITVEIGVPGVSWAAESPAGSPWGASLEKGVWTVTEPSVDSEAEGPATDPDLLVGNPVGFWSVSEPTSTYEAGEPST